MPDLSILIPARHELFLSKTIENILENIEGDTEIIAVLDGEWPEIPVNDDPRVTLIYLAQPVGQRAATNVAARVSKAKYVMKVDAHCAFDKGFDVKMMAEMADDVTLVPTMKNLHAFDWVCKKCGDRRYQSPTPTSCPKCDNTTEFERDVKWRAKPSPNSRFFRFDKTLHFQYWNDYRKRPEAQAEVAETFSIQGSCFMLTREKYWELDICDENHGSWGQQGVEVACKTWLSGGRLLTNNKTWYAHMFRTQGGDFGFPYPLTGSEIDHARKYSRKLWQGNTWPKAIHDLQWLLDKFAPIPDWHEPDPARKLSKGIVYYTDNQVNEKLGEACRQQILKGMKEKHIVSVSLKPLKFGTNIVLDRERGYLTMAKQILAGLEASTADVIFFCEHDVLYDPSHFDFVPPKKDVYYYNTNVWQVRSPDGHGLYTDDLRKLSQICAYRETLLKHFRHRVKKLEVKQIDQDFEKYVRQMGFEPGTHNRDQRVDDLKAEDRRSRVPSLDIRHDKNLTPSRWSKTQYKNQRYTKGWKEADDLAEWGNLHQLLERIMI